ncbi:MAG: UvrD-helicase domain-containing protein [Planctomycetota bacterium]
MANGYQRFALADAPLDEGTVLLEASAGTGKTYTITGILVRMLLEGVVEHVEQALVVTFTVAAADELKNRLRAGIRRALAVCLGADDQDEFFAGLRRHGKQGAQRLRRALDEFDQASVMTIHGFCKRLLEESAFESDQPFDLDFAVDEGPLWHDAAADALRSLREHDGPMFGAVMHHAKLPPDELVRLYRGWRRYPDAALDPDEPQFGVHLSNLRAAVHAAAATWDDQLIGDIEGFRWRKAGDSNKAPGRGDLHGYLRQHAAWMVEHPERCLEFLDTLAPTPMKKRILKNDEFKLERPFFAGCEEVHARWQVTLDHLRTELLRRMDVRLSALKQDRAVLTFDDLLGKAHGAIRHPRRREPLLRALGERYRVALIDEFQDTDDRQYEILSTAFANRPLFLVGDPKQSIYGFRGADLRTYLTAVEDAVTKNTLDRNFRSSQQLVQSVNQLFGRTGAFVEHDIRMHKVRANAGPTELQLDDPADATRTAPALRFRTFAFEQDGKGQPTHLKPDESRRRIAADVTAEIRRLLDGGVQRDGKPLLPRHIAVLTRRNVEAVLVQEHLREAGVVSVIGKAGDVFETEELIELERLLVAILRPNDLMRARAALTTRIWGLDALDLVELDRDEHRLEAELMRLDRWRQLWIHRGFVAMKEQLLQELEADTRMLARNDGERRLTNLQQLCEMLHEAEHDHRLSPEGLLHWLRHERTHKDEIDYQRRELRLESDEDAVQILTMHGSKGLEYDVVFCPFLWDGRNEQTRNVSLPRGDEPERGRRFAFETDKADPDWQRLEADRLAEDVRLCYVALTRAKRRCYVHWAPIGTYQGGYHWSALAWLLDPSPAADKQGWQIEWGKAYRAGSGSMYAELDKLVEATHGAIGVDRIGVDRASVDRASVDRAAQAAAARAPVADERTGSPARRAVVAGRRREVPGRRPLAVHSFSSLVAGSEPGAHAHEVRDPALRNDAPGDGIFGFARGAEAGQCLHTILENVDLDRLDEHAARRAVERTLTHHGLADADAHPGDLDPAGAVLQNLRDLAAARTSADGPSIAELCRGRRLVEWKFTMPIGVPDPQGLATRFAEHGGEVAADYADRLRMLNPRALAGFLTGFADLIAEHDGRYWVVDWKSNHLGNEASDYSDEAVRDAMQHHDYVLQYHLYVLAWHRHLTARLPDYDYDRHFGGACYAFLRGALPGETSGMFHDRPPRALVEALDDWAREERR